MTVLVRDEGAEGAAWRERVFREGQAIASALLPGFAMVVDAL